MIDNCSDMYLLNKMDVWYIKIKMRRRKENESDKNCFFITSLTCEICNCNQTSGNCVLPVQTRDGSRGKNFYLINFILATSDSESNRIKRIFVLLLFVLSCRELSCESDLRRSLPRQINFLPTAILTTLLLKLKSLKCFVEIFFHRFTLPTSERNSHREIRIEISAFCDKKFNRKRQPSSLKKYCERLNFAVKVTTE